MADLSRNLDLAYISPFEKLKRQLVNGKDASPFMGQ